MRYIIVCDLFSNTIVIYITGIFHYIYIIILAHLDYVHMYKLSNLLRDIYRVSIKLHVLRLIQMEYV